MKELLRSLDQVRYGLRVMNTEDWHQEAVMGFDQVRYGLRVKIMKGVKFCTPEKKGVCDKELLFLFIL
jgi:hypothetical protein